MRSHLRANLWLFGLSLLLCCVIYPGLLLGIGQVAFPTQAEGSLVFDRDGKPIGSRLIAQPFTADEYFQPRPSAVSYNAAASGASNWGANNPLLRDRVARQLGPIVRYRSGSKAHQLVGPDIEQWFQQKPASRNRRPMGPGASFAREELGDVRHAQFRRRPHLEGRASRRSRRAGSPRTPTHPSRSPRILPSRILSTSASLTPGRFRSPASAKRPDGKTGKNDRARAAQGPRSSRRSSTCGCRSIRRRSWNRFRPTW